ncbi:MAG: hypothetical protein IT169_05420 [Bryobacterales bacterium]|nr:hypothetical protein [Bryobacterales bacterium]
MIQPLSRLMGDAASTTRSSPISSRRTGTESSGSSSATGQSSANGQSSGVGEGATESAIAGAGALASKQTFLTLLVAQIKNQNPLNPADGTEFLSQLAQFSELEQLISIRQELEAIGKSNRASESAEGSAA